MKKKVLTTIVSTSLALSIFLPNVQAAGNTVTEMKDAKVTINEVPVNFDVPPVMQNGRTLVPLRAIFEAIGANVTWDEATQTISAVKDDKSINLVINSNIAKMNDADLQLDVPATIYKGRTVVPLRFVGEAFNGTVVWDGVTKEVKITMQDVAIKPVETVVYLNNKKLEFENFTPIQKNGTTYIPIESFLDNLTSNEIYWERKGNTIYLQLDGAELHLYIGEKNAIIDGQMVEIGQPLIEQDGKILAPINAFSKVLGGYSQAGTKANELYIYINRVKFQNEFLPKEQFTFTKPTNVSNAKFVGNRRLMISDNPEKLNATTLPEDNSTLWQDKVSTVKTSMDHRVFGWNINELGQDVTIGVTIENLSSTNEIEVVDIKGTSRQSSNGWVNYDVGLPLAEKSLSGKITSIVLSNPVVKPEENILINSFDVKAANTVGFQYDFTVKRKSGTGELNYVIRTVSTKNGEDLTTIKTDPVEIDQTARHPRGVWESSQIEAELPAYEVGSEETAYQISNGASDNLMSPEEGIGDQTQMIRNPGHFGASYIVKIPIINKTGESKNVKVRVGARGGIYNGAVKVNGKVSIIPTLKPMTEIATIVDYVIDEEQGMIEFEIMHGGGSATPLAIDIITFDPNQPAEDETVNPEDEAGTSEVTETDEATENPDVTDTATDSKEATDATDAANQQGK